MSNEYSPGKTIFTLIIAFGVIVLLVWAVISALNSSRLNENPNPTPAGVEQSPSREFERPDNYRDVPQTDSTEIDEQSNLILFGQFAVLMLKALASTQENEQVTTQKLTFN